MPTLAALLHDPALRPYWRLLLLLFVAVTAWFAFVPPASVPADTGHDKLNHLLAFGAMAGAAALSMAPGWRSTRAAAAGLLFYGAFIEAVQSFLPTRHAEWADLAADALGLAAGLLVVHLLRRVWRAAVPI